MSKLTDFINDILNPSILDDPRTAVGSMDFTRSGNRWISRRKLDGGDPREPRMSVQSKSKGLRTRKADGVSPS